MMSQCDKEPAVQGTDYRGEIECHNGNMCLLHKSRVNKAVVGTKINQSMHGEELT